MTLARMQQRRDSGSDWASTNPVLAQGEIGMDTDTGQIKIGDGTTPWSTLRGIGLVDYADAVRTAGDLSFNTTGWQNVTTTMDLVLTAKAGDLVSFVPSFSTGSTANNFAFDVATIVGGSVVNTFSGGATNGINGWFGPASVTATIQGPWFYRLQSGDISSGTVTLRMRINPATTTARVIAASAASPMRVAAINYGLLL